MSEFQAGYEPKPNLNDQPLSPELREELEATMGGLMIDGKIVDVPMGKTPFDDLRQEIEGTDS